MGEETERTTGIVRLRFADRGYRLYRNQVGSYKLSDGRWLTTGLGNRSSDLIGYVPTIITPEMVGQKVAIFTGVEVKVDLKKVYGKKEKQRLEEQREWLGVLVENGGIGFVADENGEEQICLGNK